MKTTQTLLQQISYNDYSSTRFNVLHVDWDKIGDAAPI